MEIKNRKLSSNECSVRVNLLKWIKRPRAEREATISKMLHEIYGNMYSTDERADDGESLDALFESRDV